MEPRICKFCGKEFVPTNGMQQYCNRKHTRICVVCGKEFEIPRDRLSASDARITCSRKCESVLRKQTNQEKYGGNAPASNQLVRDKMKSTTLSRYGVEYASQNASIKDKIKQTNLDKYGVDSYSQTAEWREKHDKTCREKYGTDWAIQNDKIKDKVISTNRDKYGTDYAMQNSDIRKKMQSTYRYKTGYSEPFDNPEVREKSKETLKKHYGVEYPYQSKEIRDKANETTQEHYGVENALQSDEIKDKVKQTNLERYGATCYLQSDEGKDRVRDTMLSKYGHRWISQTEDWLQSRMTDTSKIDNMMLFKADPVSFIENYDKKATLVNLANDIGVSDTSLGQYILNHDLQNYIEYDTSSMENEVYDFITCIDTNVEIEQNTHKYITPYELDLYLPQYKFAIECNPTVTHNSSLQDPWGGYPKNWKYHQMKTQLCEDRDIFLFHIFGYEWTNRRTIIESMITNILGVNSTRLYARNCDVREVKPSDATKFLNSNHRQGSSGSNIRLGLYHENELVSLMTFGKARHTIGQIDDYELIRFCSKLNYSIVGGASKLFYHFIQKYSPKSVVSFSDRAHTRGNLYKNLGFKEEKRSDPGYVWVDTRTDIAYSRLNAQKSNIKQFLQDDSIDLSKSESEIMIEHGFVQVYDSGTITWVWRPI